MSMISIITVNYNDANGLEETIKSVMAQTYRDYEHIVVDGDSSDGSKKIIDKYRDKLSWAVSEPDNGIYHAMNKGIDKARGTYLIFLNSGDCFASQDVLTKFVNTKPSADIVYGNTLLIGSQEEVFKEMPDNLLGFNMLERTLNHQSTFFKRKLFLEQKYDLSYKMLADWAFYNRQILVNKARFKHINLTVARYDTTGFSSNPDNKMIMRADRLKFYTEHIDLIETMLRQDYNQLKSKYIRLDSWKWVKLGKKLVKLRKKLLG